MKNQLLLVGLGAVALAHPAHAQNVLSSYSQVGTVAATSASDDYRYTRHTISAGGRGGHTATYYSWDPYLDQSTSASLPLPLGTPVQVGTQSSFWSPSFSVTAGGLETLTNTPKKAVLTVSYSGATVVPGTLGPHESVSVTAQPGGTFTFTVTQESNVTVSTSGDPGGVFRLFAPGAGVILGPLYGTNSPISLDTPLSPGTYWITNGLTDTSGVDTQLGTVTNPGTTSTSWGFTLTITPTGSDGSGGSGRSGGSRGSGGSGGSGGSDD